MPTTTGMKGGGYYDASSKEQRAALDVFLPYLEQAAATQAKPGGNRSFWALMNIGASAE